MHVEYDLLGPVIATHWATLLLTRPPSQACLDKSITELHQKNNLSGDATGTLGFHDLKMTYGISS
jgi:hypothetical protein